MHAIRNLSGAPDGCRNDPELYSSDYAADVGRIVEGSVMAASAQAHEGYQLTDCEAAAERLESMGLVEVDVTIKVKVLVPDYPEPKDVARDVLATMTTQGGRAERLAVEGGNALRRGRIRQPVRVGIADIAARRNGR